jgi:predicted ester cyclase
VADRDLVERLFGRLDAQDFDGVAALLTPACDLQHPAATVQGSTEAANFFRGSLSGFAECRHDLTQFLSDGDWFAVEGIWRGTNSRPMVTPDGELPATGKTVTTPFAVLGTVEKEQISSLHIYSDQLGMMAQLGLAPG